MEKNNNAPLTLDPAAGQTVSIMGGNYRILAAGSQTGGAFATIEMLVPPGGGPGPHSHASFQESFYVVEGTVEVVSEVSRYTAVKGSFVVIPKGGIVHKFKNTSNEIARLLCVVVPAGLEEMFMEMGQPVEAGTFLPPPAMDEVTRNKMNAIAEKHGQQLYPPDFLG